MLVNLNLEDLAWVLDYVSEGDEVDLDDIGGDDCVVRASKRLIGELRGQLPPIVMAAVRAKTDSIRGFSDSGEETLELWIGPEFCDVRETLELHSC